MALNKAVVEGTLKRVPSIWTLNNGMRRAIFTVRVLRENGRDYDYIDCAAYNETAESLQKVDLSKQVRITGRLITFPNPQKQKRCSLIVKTWEQTGAPEA